MKSIKKSIILAALCMLLIIPQTGCGAKEPVSREFFCLDTVCTITVYGQSQSKAEDIIAAAVEMCEEYENMLSRTVRDSDVDRINTAGCRPVEVSDDTVAVIEKGIEFGRLSDGKFDITIGAVSTLWDFDAGVLPADEDIQEALKTVDYKQITIDGNKVALGIEGAKLDLGGIAKGYIADRVTDLLKDNGVEQGIINLGGNVVTIGEKDEGTPWTVGIERPYSDRTAVIGALEVTDETVTTSGVYERCFNESGRLYHHVLDPETGYPMETAAEAVTVQGPSGMSAESDAFGTMFLMLGKDASEKILEKYPDFRVAFVDSEDKITVLNDMEIVSIE